MRIFFILIILLGFTPNLWGADRRSQNAPQPLHAVQPAPEPLTYGLVIGYNGPADSDTAALRYADDDAVKSAALLKEMGAKYVLLTELDRETQQLYPELKPTAPDLDAVQHAVAKLNQIIQADKSQNRPSQLFLFFSGHGDVEHNEGYILLRDHKWTRRQFVALLAGIHADSIHVVIDACKSYYLVFERGQRRHPASKPFLYEDANPLPANVGLLLSTSAAQQSHEWEALQSGVFSHEVRSAMRGVADLDGDRVISYQELSVFVYVANKNIPNPLFRPTLYARAPNGLELAQAALLRVPQHDNWLQIGPGVDAHYYLETANGIRLADLHPAKSLVVRLYLPASRPLFLRDANGPLEYRIDKQQNLSLAELVPATAKSAPRGAEEQAFLQLFATPLSRQALPEYTAYVEAQDAPRPAPNKWPKVVLPLSFTLSLASTVLGLTCNVVAMSEYADVTDKTDNATRLTKNQHIGLLNGIALGSYTVAALAAGTALALVLWHPDEEEIHVEQ